MLQAYYKLNVDTSTPASLPRHFQTCQFVFSGQNWSKQRVICLVTGQGCQWPSMTILQKQMFSSWRAALMCRGRSVSHPSSGNWNWGKALIPDQHLRSSDCCLLVISTCQPFTSSQLFISFSFPLKFSRFSVWARYMLLAFYNYSKHSPLKTIRVAFD